MACAQNGIHWYIPPRTAAAGRRTVDSKVPFVSAFVGVNFNHKSAIRFVPNFLEALACQAAVMETYLPRRCV